jgi:hypothetical protein
MYCPAATAPHSDLRLTPSPRGARAGRMREAVSTSKREQAS